MHEITAHVSAHISEETKAEIEVYAKRRGVKKAYVREIATPAERARGGT